MNLLIPCGGTGSWGISFAIAWISPRLLLSIIKHLAISPAGNVSNLGNSIRNKNWTSGGAGVLFRFCSFTFSRLLVFYHTRVLLSLSFSCQF